MADEAVAPEQKPQISYADFSKLDLRVAKIVDAQPVEGSAKLYKITLKVGEEARTIVSGIAEFYAPDELLGKKIILLYNLEPKKIRGNESQGMLLAAATEGEDGKLSALSLLTVDNDEIADGAKIS